MPLAAIYARQSILKEDSCSIDMQIERAKAYCVSQGWEYEVFIDEGFSGKDAERPAFQKMLSNIEQINYVVVYRLDRISRNLKDFFDLMERFNAINIGFRSLTENFDTTTPMGRAMLAIMAVFAQLERETIAERVRDNMIDRARMGYWNGGPVPLGFNKGTSHINGKERSILLGNSEEQSLVLWIYEEFLKTSIRQICRKLNSQAISTKLGGKWNPNQLSRILKNPLYCIADNDAYDYFSSLGVDIASTQDDFDGKRGLIYYNRRKPNKKTTIEREKKQWILAVGHHDGLISGKLFIEVQNKLSQYQTPFAQSGYGKKGLLVGLFKCGKCGGAMVYKDYKKSTWQYYSCNKTLWGACEGQTVKADDVENHVIDAIRNICSDTEFLKKTAAKAMASNDVNTAPLLQSRDKLHKRVDEISCEQKELIVALGRKTLPAGLIETRITELEKYRKDVQKEIDIINEQINRSSELNLDLHAVFGNLFRFNDVFEELNFDEKRMFLRSIVESITIVDDKVQLNLLFGQHNKDYISGRLVPHEQGFIEAIRLKSAG